MSAPTRLTLIAACSAHRSNHFSRTELEFTDTTGATSIKGPAGGVTVSGGGASRVFEVDALVTASISGMTITGGNVVTIMVAACLTRHNHADQLHNQRQHRGIRWQRPFQWRLLQPGGVFHADQLHH